MIKSIILIVVGFLILINGADLLVDGASNLAKKLHIPQIIIGLTIVSIGTSTPELFVSLTSIGAGYEDISLGNVIGSNICNLLLILGLSSIVKPLHFKKATKLIEIPINLFITILLFIFCNYKLNLSRVEGVILIIMFVLFITYTVLISKASIIKQAKKDNTKTIKPIPNLLLIIISIAALKFGADVTIRNCIVLAHVFNISEKIIGLTIVAIGTSLPELVTSIAASAKNNSDIAIGNIIGSNIFNILLILGLTSTINPFIYNSSYNIQLIFLIIASILILLFAYIGKKNTMTRKKGIIYLILYVFYLAILLIS